MTPEVERATVAYTKQLMAEGKLIEAGWQSLKAMAIPADAGPQQLEEMRNAFFAGAQHLWGSLINTLEEGSESTPIEEWRMSQINRELSEFIEDFSKRHGIT